MLPDNTLPGSDERHQNGDAGRYLFPFSLSLSYLIFVLHPFHYGEATDQDSQHLGLCFTEPSAGTPTEPR